jgi:hypothetical protein
MDNPDWTIAAFRERRRVTWRAIRWWLLIGSIGLAGLLMLPKGGLDDMSEAQFTENLICFIIFGISITVVSYAIKRLYRCPRCNSVPMSRSICLGPVSFGFHSDVLINPTTCPKCHARLR